MLVMEHARAVAPMGSQVPHKNTGSGARQAGGGNLGELIDQAYVVFVDLGRSGLHDGGQLPLQALHLARHAALPIAIPHTVGRQCTCQGF